MDRKFFGSWLLDDFDRLCRLGGLPPAARAQKPAAVESRRTSCSSSATTMPIRPSAPTTTRAG